MVLFISTYFIQQSICYSNNFLKTGAGLISKHDFKGQYQNSFNKVSKITYFSKSFKMNYPHYCSQFSIIHTASSWLQWYYSQVYTALFHQKLEISNATLKTWHNLKKLHKNRFQIFRPVLKFLLASLAVIITISFFPFSWTR